MKNRTIRLVALVICTSAIFMPFNVLAEGTMDEQDITTSILQTTAMEQLQLTEMTVIPLETVEESEPEPTPLSQPGPVREIKAQPTSNHAANEQVAKMDAMPDDIPATTPQPTPEPVVATPTPTATPEPTPTYEKPLSPDGQASLVDNVTDQDGKEFFTIYTEDGNVFYLIIDRQKNSENIYFLNTVTEADLQALTEGGAEEVASTPEPTPIPTVAPTPQPTPEPEPEPEKGSGLGSILLVLIVVAIAGGAGYYFKIYKPKQQSVYDEDYDEDYGEGDSPEHDEEYETYEDE